MKARHTIPALLAMLLAAPVFAQTLSSEMQRDVNQQQRIEKGLQSGQLTTREAAKLERTESKIDQAEAQAMKDGKLSDAEKSRIDRMQNRASKDIYAQSHDAQVGNPNSASSKRMQADVQRNLNQEQRIENGVKNGALTNREVAKLERGQAKVDRKEFRAGRDGRVGSGEQKQVQRAENRQSHRIHHERHDGQHRG